MLRSSRSSRNGCSFMGNKDWAASDCVKKAMLSKFRSTDKFVILVYRNYLLSGDLTGILVGCDRWCVLARIPESQGHGLERKFIVACRIVLPEVERQTSDHRSCDAVHKIMRSSHINLRSAKRLAHQPDQLQCSRFIRLMYPLWRDSSHLHRCEFNGVGGLQN